MTVKNKTSLKSGKGSRRLIGLDMEGSCSSCGMQISFGGIISVEEFSPERVILRLKRGLVEIKGELMNIVVYEGKRVEINGNITELHFISKEAPRKFFNEI